MNLIVKNLKSACQTDNLYWRCKKSKNTKAVLGSSSSPRFHCRPTIWPDCVYAFVFPQELLSGAFPGAKAHVHNIVYLRKFSGQRSHWCLLIAYCTVSVVFYCVLLYFIIQSNIKILATFDSGNPQQPSILVWLWQLDYVVRISFHA